MADLIASNRKLLEDLLYRVRKNELAERGAAATKDETHDETHRGAAV